MICLTLCVLTSFWSHWEHIVVVLPGVPYLLEPSMYFDAILASATSNHPSHRYLLDCREYFWFISGQTWEVVTTNQFSILMLEPCTLSRSFDISRCWSLFQFVVLMRVRFSITFNRWWPWPVLLNVCSCAPEPYPCTGQLWWSHSCTLRQRWRAPCHRGLLALLGGNRKLQLRISELLDVCVCEGRCHHVQADSIPAGQELPCRSSQD